MVGIGIAIIIVALLLYWFSGSSADNEIFSKFGVSPTSYTLVSTDLGRESTGKRLSGFGITGDADALFRSNRGGKVVVGEFKSRKYRGYVRPYELYQVMLYMGLVLQQRNVNSTSGVIAYADGKVTIEFDRAVFDALVSMRTEMLGGLKRKKALNTAPLHKRMNVLRANPRIKLGSKPRRR